MDDEFDPYFEWFGLPPSEGRPPNHYALLGIARYETDRDAIFAGADGRMEILKQFQNGVHAKDSHLLLNQVSYARVCLTDPQQRTAYDQQLRKRIDVHSLPELPNSVDPIPVRQVAANSDPLARTYSVPPGSLLAPVKTDSDQPQEQTGLTLSVVPHWVWLAGIGVVTLLLLAAYGIYRVVSG